MHRITRYATVAVLVSGLCSATGAPALATSAEPSVDAVAVSARGSVLDNGEPVSGADVVLRVWPNDRFLDSLSPGETFTPYVLGHVRTGSDGTFALDVDPSTIPVEFVGENDRLDVEVMAASARREIRWNYTALPSAVDSPAGGDLTLAVAEEGAAQSVAHTYLDLGRGAAWDSAHDPAAWLTSEGRRPYGPERRFEAASVATIVRTAELQHAAAVADGDVTTLDRCVVVARDTYYNRPERFITVYAWSGAKGRVVQSSGNDHTLGIGFRTPSGSWSSSGSSTRSFNASASQSGLVDVAVRNGVNYQDFTNTCGGTYRRPIGYYDLISGTSAVASRQFGGSCAPKDPGYTFKTSSAENVTYGTGTDIGPINVMAQAGYDNGVDLEFPVFQYKTFLCGNSSAGLLASSQLSTSSYY